MCSTFHHHQIHNGSLSTNLSVRGARHSNFDNISHIIIHQSVNEYRKKGQPEFKSVLIRVWNRVPGSAWCQLVDRIMQGGDRGTNLYANFQLTSTRSSLVYHLRKLKSEKKIFKFYTNENGQVFYKSSENAKKFKVTFFSTKQNDLPKTLTVTELINSFK